jgi:hypothetical protein
VSAVDELLALPKAERREWVTGEATDDDLAALFAMSRADHGTPYVLWKDDPVGFCEDILGDYLTLRQKAILESSVTERRTVVPASHAVGKSRTAARRLAHQMACHRPGNAKAISTAPTGRQVRNVLWPHVHAAHKLGDLPGRLNQIEWLFPDLSIPSAYGFSPSNYDESAVQGVHAEESLLIVVDEAGGIAHQLGQALDSITTGNTHVLAIGNPATDSEGSWFENIAEMDLWHTIHISAFDSPNFCPACQAPVYEHGEPCEECGAPTEWCPPEIARNLVDWEWVKDIAAQYGQDDPFYLARVLAQFPKKSSRRAVPTDWVEWVMLEAGEDDPDMPDSGWQRLGVDVAAGGGDEMVVAWADGWKVSIPEGGVWSGVESINQVVNAERVLEFIRAAEARQERLGYRENPVRVKVDSAGIGGGTADILERMGDEGQHSADIVRVGAGEAATDPAKFANRRAEMWWTLRDLCREQIVRLVITEREKKQITAPTFTDHKHGGRIFVEQKADLKKRGVMSPDRADAIILAVYEPEPVTQATSHRRQIDRATFPRRVGEARRRSGF